MLFSRRFLGCAAVMVGLVALGCNDLQVRKASITSAKPNKKKDATRVSLTFQVWRGDEQLNGLGKDVFTVYEDGQPATSESLNDAKPDEIKLPVVLLLDTSYSMYMAKAVGDLKAAANKFKDTLKEKGYDITVYRFANKIEPVDDISKISEEFDTETVSVSVSVRGDREGLHTVMMRSSSSSDGADNYSQNHGVTAIGTIEKNVLPSDDGGNGKTRVVHAIAFGDFKNERDKQGVPAFEGLQRLAVNGSFSAADKAGALERVFQDVASRIRNFYTFEYISPNLSGTHTIEIEVNVDGDTARSAKMSFGDAVGTGRPKPPSSGSEWRPSTRPKPPTTKP